MAIRNIRRQATNPGAVPGTTNAAPIYVDSDDNILKMIPAGSGTTEVQVVDASSVQTLTNKTLTSPTVTGATLTTATLTSPTINGAQAGTTQQIKFCTTQFDATSGGTGVTLTNVVGLTGFSVAAAGVYQFEIHISGTSTLNSGMKIGWKFTTTTLTDAEYAAEGFTASAVAVQHGTTATDQPTLFGQTAAVINVVIRGRITVNAAGTLAIQAAQNASHVDTTSVYVGSYAIFTQVA